MSSRTVSGDSTQCLSMNSRLALQQAAKCVNREMSSAGCPTPRTSARLSRAGTSSYQLLKATSLVL